MNISNYDFKTKDSDYNNDTTFSNKRFGELVKDVNELKNSSNNSKTGCVCIEEWVKIYEHTITENDFNSNELNSIRIDASLCLISITSSILNGVYQDIFVEISYVGNNENLVFGAVGYAYNEESEDLAATYTVEFTSTSKDYPSIIQFHSDFTLITPITSSFNSEANKMYYEIGNFYPAYGFISGNLAHLMIALQNYVTESTPLVASDFIDIKISVYVKNKVSDIVEATKSLIPFNDGE